MRGNRVRKHREKDGTISEYRFGLFSEFKLLGWKGTGLPKCFFILYGQ